MKFRIIAFFWMWAAAFRLFAAEPSPRDLVRKGSEEFLAGNLTNSVHSFEQAIELQPEIKPHLWQLGIAYYYAERFAEGRDLFESHQKVNPQDVENAVWHFLCVARLEGLEAARKKFIAISADARVPMKEVHSLFAGLGSEQAVLDASNAVVNETSRKNSLCYAHLYLGLYDEARGQHIPSQEHMSKAAKDFRQGHYMGQVAQIHLSLRSKKKQIP